MTGAKLPHEFTVQNVDVWNPDRILNRQDVHVCAGRIAHIVSVGTFPPSGEVFDGRGFALLPAGLDLQTHLRVPGQSEKETAQTGLRAALRGGLRRRAYDAQYETGARFGRDLSAR